LKIETSTSSTLVAYVSTPTVGGVTASLSALKMSTAVGKDGTAEVSFQTSTSFTAHPSDNKIFLTFPSGLVIAQANNLCGISSPLSIKSSSVYAFNVITLTVTSDLAAGSVTVTCSGLTLAAKARQTATIGGTVGLKIDTSKDSVFFYVSTPAVGAVVVDPKSALQMKSSAGSDSDIAVSFTTSTVLQPSSSNKITLTFPNGLVSASTENKCGVTSSECVVTSKFDGNAITLTLAPYASLPAGKVTITCSGLTIAPKEEVVATTGTTNGLKIETSTDVIPDYANTPAVGGVTAALDALTMSTAVSPTGTATVSFTTSTPLTVAGTGKITLTFPAGLVDAQAINLCAIASPPSVSSTSAFDGTGKQAVTLTLTADLVAAAVTVTCSGMTLKALAGATATVGGTTGLRIETSTSSTLVAYVSTPTVGGVEVSLTSASSFSADLSSSKTLEITSNVDVWTLAEAPSVTCSVSSFTNAAVTTRRHGSRSLMQSNLVEISMVKADNTVVGGAPSPTGQTFPASIPAPATRTLYLPKAAGVSFGVAWIFVGLFVSMLCI